MAYELCPVCGNVVDDDDEWRCGLCGTDLFEYEDLVDEDLVDEDLVDEDLVDEGLVESSPKRQPGAGSTP